MAARVGKGGTEAARAAEADTAAELANRVERIAIEPRPDWKQKVEPLGMVFHTTLGKPYWCESAYYRFSADQIDLLESATNDLHEMCLAAVQHIIDHSRLHELDIPDAAVPAIIASWDSDPPALYARFDLAYDGVQPPRMLEYNADTPTTLLEAAVIQWYWLQDRFPQADQFNSIWEALIAKWSELKQGSYLQGVSSGGPVYFAHLETTEDLMTVSALRDTAEQAGVPTQGIHIRDIGWDKRLGAFVDRAGAPMQTIFKLYPWEWILSDPFGSAALETLGRTQWIEPIWKMLLSNKGILPILWELYPGHPYLLETYFDHPHGMEQYVRKPLLSREGANITLHDSSGVIETGGPYGAGRCVYQALGPVPCFEGARPVVGSWVIGDESCGIGIRESDGPITDNLSRFVPHVFEPRPT